MAAILPLSGVSQPAHTNPQILATHPFTCNTCQVAFRSSEQQRHHMHSDWHRYNLKRKIAQLPPISSETFAEKVLHAQAQTRLESQRANFEKKCHACDKIYYSENAYNNHVGSLKHRQNVAAIEKAIEKSQQVKKAAADKDETESVISSTFSMGEPVGAAKTADDAEKRIAGGVVDKDITAEELSAKVTTLNLGSAKEAKEEKLDTVMEDAEVETKEPWPVTTCMFCSYDSPTLQLNVSHMYKAHGLFIPEQQYLVDLEGLIRYLNYKIGVGNQCLFCNKFKGGVEGVRIHMKDKQHCRIPFETEDEQVELGDFYDFRPSYDDYVEGEETGDEEYEPRKKGLKPNFKIEDLESDGEDEGWETDSSASSLDSEELCAVPIDHDHSGRGHHLDKPRHHKEDGYHVHAHAYPIYHDDYELHLPSGRSVGRRQYARYYRQHIKPAATTAVADTRHPRRRRSSERRHSSDDERIPDAPSTILSRRERRAEVMGIRSGQIVRRKTDIQGLAGVSKEGRREITKMEKRGREVEERGRRRFDWGVEKRGNNQKHYRDPLLQ